MEIFPNGNNNINTTANNASKHVNNITLLCNLLYFIFLLTLVWFIFAYFPQYIIKTLTLSSVDSILVQPNNTFSILKCVYYS